MEKLEFLNETERYVYFRNFFQGTEVIFVQDKKKPGELMISGESIAKVLGYGSFQEMISSDKILDSLNKYMKETGNPFPLKPMYLNNSDKP